MTRMFGVVLVVALAAIWCGCPEPLEQQEGGQPGSLTRPADDAGEARPGTEAPDATAEQPEPLDDDGLAEGEAAAEDADGDDGDLGAAAEVPEPDEAAPADDAGSEPPAMDDEAVDATEVAAEPAEPDMDVQTALDPERLLAAHETEPAYEHTSARVSSGSLAFAGRWSVAILNLEGRARQAEYDDEWTFELVDDGTCTVSQRVGGDILRQRGGWELSNEVLTLLMGPGGQRQYHVENWRADVAALTDTLSGAVLFCLRQDAAATAPEVRRSYMTSFGELRLRRSGQAWWRSSYGEPEGTVLVRQVGRFLVGTWEQQPDRGFVIFELTAAGLDGWWWYQDSLSFDGEWTVPDPA